MKVYLVVSGSFFSGLILRGIFSTKERADGYLDAFITKVEKEIKDVEDRELLIESTYVFSCGIDQSSPALGYFLYYITRRDDGKFHSLEIPEYVLDISPEIFGKVKKFSQEDSTLDLTHGVYIRADSRKESLDIGKSLINRYIDYDRKGVGGIQYTLQMSDYKISF